MISPAHVIAFNRDDRKGLSFNNKWEQCLNAYTHRDIAVHANAAQPKYKYVLQ